MRCLRVEAVEHALWPTHGLGTSTRCVEGGWSVIAALEGGGDAVLVERRDVDRLLLGLFFLSPDSVNNSLPLNEDKEMTWANARVLGVKAWSRALQ